MAELGKGSTGPRRLLPSFGPIIVVIVVAMIMIMIITILK